MCCVVPFVLGVAPPHIAYPSTTSCPPTSVMSAASTVRLPSLSVVCLLNTLVPSAGTVTVWFTPIGMVIVTGGAGGSGAGGATGVNTAVATVLVPVALPGEAGASQRALIAVTSSAPTSGMVSTRWPWSPRTRQCQPALLAPGGRLVSYGAAAGQPDPAAPTLADLRRNNWTTAGFSIINRARSDAGAVGDLIAGVFALTADGLAIPAPRVIGWREAIEAHIAQAENRSPGKTVVAVRG